MSMKVYNAFRVKDPDPKKLWPLLWKIRNKAEALVVAALKAHYWDLVRKMDTETKEYLEARGKLADTREASFRLAHARDNVRKAYKENSTSAQRDRYSLDVTVAVYPYRGEVYLRTFVESISIVGHVLDFVPKMRELEDYHYQNQTDRPEEVSAKDWRQRRRVWDGITSAYQDIGSHVALEVFSWGSFYRLDPWLNMATEWSANQPELPIREEVWAEELRKLKALEGVEITAREGRIRGGKRFSVFKEIDGKWTSIIDAKARRHKTLNRAADHVWFKHQPAETQEYVNRMIAEAKERRRAAKK